MSSDQIIISSNEKNIQKFPKFIFVSGGVISGLGKGVTTSFLGAILQAHGHSVTSIKIDPYINIDAGTFSPYEHGEVFVLDDGSEVDLDLGNYERMLDIKMTGENNLTTGKIFSTLISNERQGKYLGKTVQIIPHFTDEVQMRLINVGNSISSNSMNSKICMVEIGGTVGDIESMPFLESIRHLQNKIGTDNFCHIHISLIPQTIDGDFKTKPTQSFVRIMKSQGLIPDIIFCRSKTEINQSIKDKISIYCDIPNSHIICLPDLENNFLLIPLLHNQNIANIILKRLKLPETIMTENLQELLKFSEKCILKEPEVRISIIGKYSVMKDAYYSIKSSIFHASVKNSCNVKIDWINSEKLEPSYVNTSKSDHDYSWKLLGESKGVIIPGGFDQRGVEGMILASNFCRINKIPVLGICLGFQIMLIEYARNVLNLKEANSVEINPNTQYPVVIEMPEFNPIHKGGSMRLGLRKTIFSDTNSQSKILYKKKEYILERHRHRFEFNLDFKNIFEENGYIFAGHDESGKRMEIGEISDKIHPFYIGVQYHPEFLSKPLKPSPLFSGFIKSILSKHNQ